MELIEEVDIVWFCEKQNKALLKQTKARHGDTHLQSQHAGGVKGSKVQCHLGYKANAR